MQSGLYVSLSSQMALERRLTTIADNMANVNTVGFRATDVKFDQVLSKTQNDINAKIAFVNQGNDYLSTRNGELSQTGNTLDFAVKGDAWFAINTPVGQVLTRDGRFTMKETGELVSVQGYPVLDAGGAPIQLNRAGGPPTVGADGKIVQDDRQVATIGLFSADITKGFVRFENSGVSMVDQPKPVVDNAEVAIMQGYLENSNVNGIGEMTQLIQVNRAFESISSLMRDSESSLSDAIKVLGGSS
ncbi:MULTISPECIES: flagellar basal-body rod protein FlgF [Alphaproteobacteria]|uniref:Flagellar basal-body rod protein FlgF n=2 Tax=Alphaproteobacteria TaxID=28211 RepID=A0A512HDL5_9HYPH|nr:MULTISPECIES: flagellar basal-body rod protein FlgF [Alphaproteobacteria]GEO83450.1 flagellar basal-body rod protein FlgF [Ciceribacter naphthalenivorans]GLR24400.1 flagellar basal-body rod protein FlgF [Ciceribacter naphthalenivorans]GLT07256.1 flagellar basal-body rod protein FlgF [Sphingomonas psychrolutea]